MPPLKSPDATSSERPRTAYYNEPVSPTKSEPKKRGKSTSPANSLDKNYDSNWAFKPPKDQVTSKSSQQQAESVSDDPKMSEQLLLNHKKDAEIASLMNHLHFNEYGSRSQFDQRTMTP